MLPVPKTNANFNTNLCDQDPSQDVSEPADKPGTVPTKQPSTVADASGPPPWNIHPCPPLLFPSPPSGKQHETVDQIEILADVHDIPSEISLVSMEEEFAEINDNI